jgi:H+/Cl- antiporter ClcA
MFKIVKVFFFLAAFLLVGKTFLGFGLFNRTQSHEEVNTYLLQKLFSKRKQEYLEEDLAEAIAIQQQLANPFTRLILTFSAFLAILSLFSKSFFRLTGTAIDQISCILSNKEDTYLHTRQLII